MKNKRLATDSQMTQKTKNRKLCLLFKLSELSCRAVHHQCDKNQHSRSCEVHRMRKLRERRAGGRTTDNDGTDAGRTGSERPDNPGTEQAAKQIADLEREIEQRKQSREYRSIADKIKANRGTINQRDRQQEKSRRRSRGMEI